MKMLTLALVSAVSAVLLSDAAPAQTRGGDGGRAHGGGAVVHGGAGAGGAHRWHGGYAGRGYGGAWYGGSYRGWYGPGVGIYLSGPLYWGPWAYPYYGAYPGYYPYPAYLPSEPLAYVEQSSAPAANYWYYCRDPAGYFPHVQQCSSAWMTVVPPREAGRANSSTPAQ